jgi:hypothetical protein
MHSVWNRLSPSCCHRRFKDVMQSEHHDAPTLRQRSCLICFKNNRAKLTRTSLWKGDAPWPNKTSPNKIWATCLAETHAPNAVSRSPRPTGSKPVRSAPHISGTAAPAITRSRRWLFSTTSSGNRLRPRALDVTRSSREPASTSLGNALSRRLPALLADRQSYANDQSLSLPVVE